MSKLKPEQSSGPNLVEVVIDVQSHTWLASVRFRYAGNTLLRCQPVWLEGFQFPVHLSIHPPSQNQLLAANIDSLSFYHAHTLTNHDPHSTSAMPISTLTYARKQLKKVAIRGLERFTAMSASNISALPVTNWIRKTGLWESCLRMKALWP